MSTQCIDEESSSVAAAIPPPRWFLAPEVIAQTVL